MGTSDCRHQLLLTQKNAVGNGQEDGNKQSRSTGSNILQDKMNVSVLMVTMLESKKKII
jgi:hypothetical protein